MDVELFAKFSLKVSADVPRQGEHLATKMKTYSNCCEYRQFGFALSPPALKSRRMHWMENTDTF